jgi:cyclomaltodextrinase
MKAFHKSSLPFASAFSLKYLDLVLLISRDSLSSKSSVIFGDPFEYQSLKWVTRSQRMELTGEDDTYQYWSVRIQVPPSKRTRYYFKINHENTCTYLCEKGKRDIPPEFYDTYAVPYIAKSDLFQAPDWVKNTVWYQIFPERFKNGNKSLNPPGVRDWNPNEAPTRGSFYGGDLSGITEKLDYLADLGIGGIYLTPIFFSRTNHKYDTIDYLMIDPHFGDTAVFKKFVQAAHDRGIKVMLDAVFNHCGLEFFAFKDVREKGRKSKYYDWFYMEKTLETHLQQDGLEYKYETFSFEDYMPKLNTENEEVKKYLLEVARFWLEECGIDAWRLDVANEVSHSFWRDFRKVVKKAKPDVYILGEIWHDSMPWLLGDEFDSVMNYPLCTLLERYFALSAISTSEFHKELSIVRHLYPLSVSRYLFNIIDSHDTPRALTVAGGDVRKLKLMMLFQFTYPGTPCLYYGDEIGLQGGSDPLCRGCMEWDETKWNHKLHSFVKSLITLRKTHTAFGGEGYFHLQRSENETECLLYRKSAQPEALPWLSPTGDILFFLNNTDKTQEVDVKFSCEGDSKKHYLRDLFGHSHLSPLQEVGSFSFKVSVEPLDFFVGIIE